MLVARPVTTVRQACRRPLVVIAVFAVAVAALVFVASRPVTSPAVRTVAADGPIPVPPPTPQATLSTDGMDEPAGYVAVGMLQAAPTGPDTRPVMTGGHFCLINTTVVDCDPWLYADAAVRHATQAGIDPRLLLAVMTNEQCAHVCPVAHSGLAEWLRTHLNGALGITNIHPDTFNEVKAAHPDVIGDATWEDLANDPDLAVKTTAYKLADIAQALPAQWPANWTRDQLTAAGYNAGTDNMIAYSQGTTPAYQVAWYGNNIAANWQTITTTLCQSGGYTCTH